MVIGIDLDDVLCAFMPAYLALANARFGRPALDAKPIDWEWSNVLPNVDEQNLVWTDVANIPNFWETLAVERGVTPRLLYRLDQKHDVYFPTARSIGGDGSFSAANQSAYWLRKNFNIEFPKVIVSYYKKPMALALKYDYFIDDRPKNCLDIQSVLPNCKVFVKDTSHNQTFDAFKNGMKRVSSFDEFANIVMEGK